MALRLTPDTATSFIRANTALMAPPHVPEVQLHLAAEAFGLWKKTEEELQEIGLPQHAIPVALAFFNIGVELGQLLFIYSLAILQVGGSTQ